MLEKTYLVMAYTIYSRFYAFKETQLVYVLWISQTIDIIKFRSLRKHLATVKKSSRHFHLIGLFGQGLTNQNSLHFNPPQEYISSLSGRLKQFSHSFQREHIGCYRCLEKQQSIIRSDSERFWADMLTNFLPAFSA